MALDKQKIASFCQEITGFFYKKPVSCWDCLTVCTAEIFFKIYKRLVFRIKTSIRSMNPVLLQGWIAFFETLDAVLTGRLAAVATDFFLQKNLFAKKLFFRHKRRSWRLAA
jgi:hypothetical protein